MKRIIVITGANRGIGFATAQTLLKQGDTVIITSRNQRDGDAAAAELQQFGDLHYHPLDVCSSLSIENLIGFIKKKFERLDVLINNAGINYDTWHTSITADLNQVGQTLDTNLMGAWRMAQAAIPLMEKNGFGRIVNVSSGAGSFGEGGNGAPGYAISKAAMNMLTVKLAENLQGTEILVNSVCPGWVRTNMGGQAAPRSPEEGAASVVWAANLPANGPSGKFFRDGVEIPF